MSDRITAILMDRCVKVERISHDVYLVSDKLSNLICSLDDVIIDWCDNIMYFKNGGYCWVIVETKGSSDKLGVIKDGEFVEVHIDDELRTLLADRYFTETYDEPINLKFDFDCVDRAIWYVRMVVKCTIKTNDSTLMCLCYAVVSNGDIRFEIITKLHTSIEKEFNGTFSLFDKTFPTFSTLTCVGYREFVIDTKLDKSCSELTMIYPLKQYKTHQICTIVSNYKLFNVVCELLDFSNGNNMNRPIICYDMDNIKSPDYKPNGAYIMFPDTTKMCDFGLNIIYNGDNPSYHEFRFTDGNKMNALVVDNIINSNYKFASDEMLDDVKVITVNGREFAFINVTIGSDSVNIEESNGVDEWTFNNTKGDI